MSKIRKALVAGLSAALSALVAAVASGEGLSAVVVGGALAAGVVAGWATWQVPNAR